MDDEKTNETVESVVSRVLDENDLDSERVLVMLLRTMADDLVRARGGAGSGRNVLGNPNALDCVLHALMQRIQRDREDREQAAADAAEDPSAAPVLADDASGDASVRESLCEMAMECLRIAENELGPEDRPRMRLVE